MKKKWLSVEQIAAVLNEAEAGITVAELIQDRHYRADVLPLEEAVRRPPEFTAAHAAEIRIQGWDCR